jgi:hypothetical protein
MFDRSKIFQDEEPYSLPGNSSSSSGGSGEYNNFGQKKNQTQSHQKFRREMFSVKSLQSICPNLTMKTTLKIFFLRKKFEKSFSSLIILLN